LHVYDLHLI